MRKHRGPAPGDLQLLTPDRVAAMRAATHDLSWLRRRGYAPTGSIELVEAIWSHSEAAPPSSRKR